MTLEVAVVEIGIVLTITGHAWLARHTSRNQDDFAARETLGES